MRANRRWTGDEQTGSGYQLAAESVTIIDMSTAPKALMPSNTPDPLSLPGPIRETLRSVRRLLARFVFSQALVQWMISSVLAFWLFGFIDYLPAMMGAAESPRWIRIGMLGMLGVGSAYILYQQIWRRWLVRWSDDAIALLIERRYPDFQSSLITTVQASRPAGGELAGLATNALDEHPQRRGFLGLARQQALEHIPKVDVASLVQIRPLQLQMATLGIVLAFSLTVGLLYPKWTAHWSKRLFTLSNAPWPRSVALGVIGIELEVPSFTGGGARGRYLLPFVNDRVAVPKGQSGMLKSYASLGASRVPDLCTVYYRDEEGNRGRANMRRVAANVDQQGFLLDGPPLESINQSLNLSIVGGDARLSDLLVEAVDAPLITKAELRVQYPPYLQRSTQTRWGEEILPYQTGLRLPQGSVIELIFTSNKPIQRCDYVFVKSSDTAGGTLKEQSFDNEKHNETWTIPLGTLDSSILAEFRVWDTDGICASRVQQFVISSIIDQSPQVDMVLDGIGTAITEIATIPVQGKVKDEYDVREVWIETLYGEGTPLRQEVENVLDGTFSTVIDCKELKDAGKLPIQAGNSLAMTLVASDYYDLVSEPHLGKANTVQLSVVTPDQLLLLLDRREAAMRKRVEQIIGELTQLRDLLNNIQKRSETATSDSSDPTNDENNPARVLRIQLLRSQQAMSQISKSEGELAGVEREIGQISKELIHNRIDSVDRRTRWQEKIQAPLREMLDGVWKGFSGDIAELEKLFSKASEPLTVAPTQLIDAIKKNDEILSRLQAVLADMLEIQDQTAIIDMLRDIIQSSDQLIDETKTHKKNQDRKALELLK
jgi:hypothetical protein